LKAQRDILQKMDKALFASEGEMSIDERQTLKTKIDEWLVSLQKNAEKTIYHGVAVLGGQETKFSVPLADKGSKSIVIDLMKATPESLGLSNLDAGTPEGAAAAIKKVKSAMAGLTKGYDRLVATSKKIAKA